MNSNRRDFDIKANDWDDNPQRIKLANDIFRSISREVLLLPTMDIMDFGCGTGLLTLQFRPLVHSITGFDSSEGMLNVFRKKVIQEGLIGVDIRHLNHDNGEQLKGRYHLIISSMALHHIKDMQSLLSQFYKLILPSGHLCIADLDLDNGKFHNSDEGVFHHGFDLENLRDIFEKTGFDAIRHVQAAKVVKTGSDRIVRQFSIFLMIGRRG